MDERQQRRLAQNEALARDVNQRVGEVAAPWYDQDESIGFVCECSAENCERRVNLTMEQYARVRSSRVWFVVVPEHVNPAIERTVEALGDGVIVEKIGAGRDVADETAS
jgi:hypothetical protein